MLKSLALAETAFVFLAGVSCRGRHAVRPRPALSGRRSHPEISA
jgi:hypothetical protein